VTVRLSGVVTMGYSWLITVRCDCPYYQHAESSMGREAVGGVYNNPFLGCLLFCSALIVAWWWKPSKYKHENVYIRARLKPGWVWWVFYFTFECCEFLPAQTISFSRPSLMKPWMLRAKKVSPSL